MEELLTFILQRITNHPQEVIIEREDIPETSSVVFNVSLHKDDVGLVIGKNGKVVKSIRNLINIVAISKGLHLQLNIQEKVTPSETS